MTWDAFSEGTGLPEASNVTDLRMALFLRQHDGVIGTIRNPVAGIVTTIAGVSPHRWNGILNPDADYPFEASKLPEVDFGRVLVDHRARQLQVEWPTKTARLI